MTITNAMRLLKQAGIPYDTAEYEVDENIARDDIEEFISKLQEGGILQ